MGNEKQVYCLKCKKHTDNKDPQVVIINDKPSLKAVCSECGKAKHVFVKKDFKLEDQESKEKEADKQ